MMQAQPAQTIAGLHVGSGPQQQTHPGGFIWKPGGQSFTEAPASASAPASTPAPVLPELPAVEAACAPPADALALVLEAPPDPPLVPPLSPFTAPVPPQAPPASAAP
jgi:hypothetical protein